MRETKREGRSLMEGGEERREVVFIMFCPSGVRLCNSMHVHIFLQTLRLVLAHEIK